MDKSGKPEPAYTRAELQRWNTDMLLKRPTTRYTGDEVTGVKVVSFDIGASRNGFHMLIVNGHGEEMRMLFNPVLAAAIRDGIAECGRQGGWLDDDGTPFVPIK